MLRETTLDICVVCDRIIVANELGEDAYGQSYALSGLGGIGKTQTAIEYAYRYANEYVAIFWISAETYESIVSSFVTIAGVLNLPEKQEKEQRLVMDAVTRWLTSHNDWLAIFDNVEDLELVKSVLQPARCGSLLFTSRRQALGFVAQTLDLKQMTLDEGIRFLLHRARLLDPDAPLDTLSSEDIGLAREIVAVMDGLPLALDQAGAYIEETRCSLADYLRLFQTAHIRLLDVRETHTDHPFSVTRTFGLAFERLERENPAAVELLTVCAFLAPEAIPESFFIEGAIHLGPTFEKLAADPFEFHAAVKALLRYSLVSHNAENKTVTIHRLVQVVLRGRLSEDVQQIWMKRVLTAMGQRFPLDGEKLSEYWEVCEQLLPHAQVCLAVSNQELEKEVAHVVLTNRVARYLVKRARYSEASLLYHKALHIGEQLEGSDLLHVAEALYGLGDLYREQGKYELAEEVFQNALHMRENVLGSEHPQVATSLNSLGLLYLNWGKYELAAPLFLRAIQIREQVLGSEHPQVPYPLNNLGILYYRMGKYELAEELFQKAIRIWEKTLGLEHPQLAYAVINLGSVYMDMERYELVEELFQRALYIWERAFGPEHTQTVCPVNNLADFYSKQEKCTQAEQFYKRALHVWEQSLGPDHPNIAYPLNGLANLYHKQREEDRAESFYHRALYIREQHLDPCHPDIAETLHDLAAFKKTQGKVLEVVPLYERALKIRAQSLGSDHPKTKATCIAYTQLLLELGRVNEAEAIDAQLQVTDLSPKNT